ncbi:MAG: DUF1565 domain-containing protein, partial [Acidimicrobiia bacterium]|nr:DUF1565 domain-containing protein [Acidimicrobiia bacterium]
MARATHPSSAATWRSRARSSAVHARCDRGGLARLLVPIGRLSRPHAASAFKSVGPRAVALDSGCQTGGGTMPGLTTSRNSRSTRRSPLARLARFVLVGAVAALLPACTDPGTGKEQAVPEPMAGYGAAPLGSVSYPVPPGARYVAPNGNDAAAGTEAAPWRTLAHAVSAAPGGSTIVMRGGTYRESVEVPATRSLTIQPAAGEEVWLSGSDPISGFVRDG